MEGGIFSCHHLPPAACTIVHQPTISCTILLHRPTVHCSVVWMALHTIAPSPQQPICPHPALKMKTRVSHNCLKLTSSPATISHLLLHHPRCPPTPRRGLLLSAKKTPTQDLIKSLYNPESFNLVLVAPDSLNTCCFVNNGKVDNYQHETGRLGPCNVRL